MHFNFKHLSKIPWYYYTLLLHLLPYSFLPKVVISQTENINLLSRIVCFIILLWKEYVVQLTYIATCHLHLMYSYLSTMTVASRFHKIRLVKLYFYSCNLPYPPSLFPSLFINFQFFWFHCLFSLSLPCLLVLLIKEHTYLLTSSTVLPGHVAICKHSWQVNVESYMSTPASNSMFFISLRRLLNLIRLLFSTEKIVSIH